MLGALVLTLLGGVTVELPAFAKVRGTELRLGDVAVIRGDDEDAVRRASMYVLGQTPSPGYARQLMRDDIARELRALLGDAEVLMRGAPMVRISTLTMTVTAEEQIKEAERALDQVFAGRDVEFEARAKVEDLFMPQPRDSFSVKARTASMKAVPGPQGVALDVTIDGVLWRTLWSSWNVDVYETWPVLRSAVAKGETVYASQFENRRVQVSAGRITLPLGRDAYGTAEARRDLPVGRVVLEEDVVRAWTVKRGDLVQLEVKSGDVVAQVRGIVMSNGRIGDRVSVKLQSNDPTKEHEVSARVVNRSLLRIDLTVGKTRKAPIQSDKGSVAR